MKLHHFPIRKQNNEGDDQGMIFLTHNKLTVARVPEPRTAAALQQIVYQKTVSLSEFCWFNLISFSFQNLAPEDFYLTLNGRKVDQDAKDLFVDSRLEIVLRVLGGKGGFGSMLRAIGAQIEKTTNRDACRDLSGRRLRDINEEKRLKAWLEKEQDKKSDTYAKKKKKLERLLSQPKHDFKDEEYDQARSELTANVDEAVTKGFEKIQQQQPSGSSNNKRTLPQSTPKTKLWIADGLSSGSDDDSDTDEEPIVKKKAK